MLSLSMLYLSYLICRDTNSKCKLIFITHQEIHHRLRVVLSAMHGIRTTWWHGTFHVIWAVLPFSSPARAITKTGSWGLGWKSSRLQSDDTTTRQPRCWWVLTGILIQIVGLETIDVGQHPFAVFHLERASNEDKKKTLIGVWQFGFYYNEKI